MRGFANESHLDVWYDRFNASELVDRFGGRLGKRGRILFTKPFAKARRKTSLRAVEKLTERVDGELRFRSVPPLLVRLASSIDPNDLARHRLCSRGVLDATPRASTRTGATCSATYRFVDMARKVVGVGSVGTRAWVLLFVGRAGRRPAGPADEGGAGIGARAPPRRERVREPRRARRPRPADGSQAAFDVFLGWQRSVGLDGKEHDFYIRQLWDWKASIDLSTMTYSGLHAYARACGWSLARAHARSGDRLAIAAYLGAGPSSTARSPASPPRMPTRTSSITGGSPRLSRPAKLPRSPGSER